MVRGRLRRCKLSEQGGGGVLKPCFILGVAVQRNRGEGGNAEMKVWSESGDRRWVKVRRTKQEEKKVWHLRKMFVS